MIDATTPLSSILCGQQDLEAIARRRRPSAGSLLRPIEGSETSSNHIHRVSSEIRYVRKVWLITRVAVHSKVTMCTSAVQNSRSASLFAELFAYTAHIQTYRVSMSHVA